MVMLMMRDGFTNNMKLTMIPLHSTAYSLRRDLITALTVLRILNGLILLAFLNL